jgi:predicted nuclease with RNAse H fold
VRYCGIVASGSYVHLCALEEVREPEPPIKLDAIFYEPATPEQVAAEIRAFGDAVVGIAAPIRGARDGDQPGEGEREAAGEQLRVADAALRVRGVMPAPYTHEGRRMFQALANRGLFSPDAPEGVTEGEVGEGSYESMPVFETNADAVFCALQGVRMPAKRHPIGVLRRIEELTDDHVLDSGGELWHRRIEEIEAAAAALCAHRYAVGHACWVGRPSEGVVVLPGSRLPESFSGQGVLPPVERVVLPDAPR